jgi:hypothetical protein
MRRDIVQVNSRDVLRVGRRLSQLPGVASVTADPIRGQLVVTYREGQMDGPRVSDAARGPSQAALSARTVALTPWLARVPRLLAAVL